MTRVSLEHYVLSSRPLSLLKFKAVTHKGGFWFAALPLLFSSKLALHMLPFVFHTDLKKQIRIRYILLVTILLPSSSLGRICVIIIALMIDCLARFLFGKKFCENPFDSISSRSFSNFIIAAPVLPHERKNMLL